MILSIVPEKGELLTTITVTTDLLKANSTSIPQLNDIDLVKTPTVHGYSQ